VLRTLFSESREEVYKLYETRIFMVT